MAPAVGTSNTKYNWNFLYGKYNMLRVCKDLYASLAHESAGNTTCGRTFNTYQTSTVNMFGRRLFAGNGEPMDKQFVLDCGPRDDASLAWSTEPGHDSALETVSAPYAVLSLCAKTYASRTRSRACPASPAAPRVRPTTRVSSVHA